MNPSIKAGVATYSPSGFIDGNNSSVMFDINQLRALENRKVKAIVISFKDVVLFNKIGLTYMHDLLIKISSEINNIIVGFVDYTKKHYDQVLRMIPELGISLFETMQILRLFVKKDEQK